MPAKTQYFNRNTETTKQVDTAWKSACEKAGIEGLLFHNLQIGRAHV